MGKKDNFVGLLVQFYGSLMGSLGDAVLKLVEIEKKHKKSYKQIQKIQTDPVFLFTQMEKLSTEKKALLLDVIAKVGKIDRQFKRVLELSVADKQKLAKDIKNFNQWIQGVLEKNVSE